MGETKDKERAMRKGKKKLSKQNSGHNREGVGRKGERKRSGSRESEEEGLTQMVSREDR